MEQANISTPTQTDFFPKQGNYPAVTPPSPKFSPPLIATFVLLVISGAVGGFFLGKSFSQPKTSPPSISQTSPTQKNPTPTSDPTVNWKTYSDPDGGFSIRYPANWTLGDLGGKPLLNRRINWWFQETSYRSCKGDCPIVTSSKEVLVSDQRAIKIKGWVGEIGGNVPQSFIRYEIEHPKNKKFFNITLWELPQDISIEERNTLVGRKIGEISNSDENLFDLILSTFKFLD